MGSKRPSVRTLPSGEKVVHNPDGTQRLVPAKRVEALLDASSKNIRERLSGIEKKFSQDIESKRQSLDSGQSVPHDKRPI